MILGIKNRTENWTTVGHLFDLRNNKLIRHLMRNNGDDSAPFDDGSEARLELFWYGYRDYIFGKNITLNTVKIDAIYDRFLRLFPNLQENVLRFMDKAPKYLRVKKTANYALERENAPLSLFHNIRNTEIDIVIETRKKLYIGEVKDSQTFGANGNLFLPHQLLRQYITARILVDELGKDLDIVPFIISNDSTETHKNGQVKLMESLSYLDIEKNVFTWHDIT